MQKTPFADPLPHCSADVLTPVASYPIYRATAVDPSILAFWQHWLALPFWHSGPPWFLWVLLVFDLAAAAMFVLARQWGDALARWSARPRPYLLGLMLASALAYVPLALAFTPWEWGQVGPSRCSSAGRCITRSISSPASGSEQAESNAAS
jgi:hypothetical protein